jgi:hypothetical protein
MGVSYPLGLPKRLYALEEVDTALEDNARALMRVDSGMKDRKALNQAELRLETDRKQLAELEEQQRAAEWEVEDTSAKVSHEQERLYGGSVRNPKELMDLEKELGLLKTKLRDREDKLLDVMGQVEEKRNEVREAEEEFGRLKREFEERIERLGEEKGRLETEVFALREKREGMVANLDDEVLNLYEELRRAKGRAIAKMEQGNCMGCGIALPTSDLTRVRAGEMVQCSHCQRILYIS